MVNLPDRSFADSKKGYREIVSRVLSVSYHISIAIISIGVLLYLTGVDSSLSLTVIKAGLLVLLATPLLRVLVSAIVFHFLEKDRKYAFISMVVFLILIFSMVLGHSVK